MLRFSSNLFQSLYKQTSLLTFSNKQLFAKQPKQAKDNKKGGKQQKKPQVVVQQQPHQKLAPHQKLIHYFTPLQPGLSPSQQQAIQTKFSDIPQVQKQMLDKLAQRIAELNTSMFYDFVYNRQGLGTAQAYVIGSGEFKDEEVKNSIKVLRKDV